MRAWNQHGSDLRSIVGDDDRLVVEELRDDEERIVVRLGQSVWVRASQYVEYDR